ncbi:hypothetical protein GCHA_4505 [Paraglaciecola chathamensis S18K6]|uniref:Uncharacterized protein n=1 Tax=Paraglaciecola chathamensis S18K6 TaxID=1127672 RepID=A0AAV3V744_9ALTE|nr:hypothetical protein GCHA_4505 [Paraglaciecola chathamensis S18K6]
MAGRSARCCYAAKETGFTPDSVPASGYHQKQKSPNGQR